MIGDIFFAIARLLFAVVSGIADWWSRRREGAAVRLRKSLDVKAELNEKLPEVLRETNGDVVIREVRRKDRYPEVDDSLRRISPWFNVELKGLYYNGLEVFLRVEQALIDDDVAKQVSLKEPGSQKVFVVGRIPFWRIEAIDWDGDEFYGFTHIYCRFRRFSKGPYESIVLYEINEDLLGSRRYSRLEGIRWKPKRFGLFSRWKSRRGLRKAEKEHDRKLQELELSEEQEQEK